MSGAVCTDLDKVHKVLGLAPNEHIMSPVVEYSSEPQVRFHRPVQVILPHFLPLSWAEPAMTVYSVQQDARGEVAVAKLKLWHQGSSPDARPQGGQYYIHNNRIHIFTDHFTAFFCSVCSEECPPQPLLLDVWAKHCRDVDLVWEQEQGIGSLVEIRLYIWIGGQYMIKDFRAVSCMHFVAVCALEKSVVFFLFFLFLFSLFVFLLFCSIILIPCLSFQGNPPPPPCPPPHHPPSQSNKVENPYNRPHSISTPQVPYCLDSQGLSLIYAL